MSFSNPFSAKTDDTTTVTAAEINAAGVSISRALDGTAGGTYTPSSALAINGSGLTSTAIGASTVTSTLTIGGTGTAGLVYRVDNAVTVDGTAAVTIDTKKDLYIFGTPTGARTITVRITTAPVPTTGMKISVIRPTAGGFDYTLINETLGTSIAILGANTWVCLEMIFNGTKWLVTSTSDASGIGTGGKP